MYTISCTLGSVKEKKKQTKKKNKNHVLDHKSLIEVWRCAEDVSLCPEALCVLSYNGWQAILGGQILLHMS